MSYFEHDEVPAGMKTVTRRRHGTDAIYRKTVACAMPVTGNLTRTTAHGELIGVVKRLSGVATNGTTSVALPHSDPTTANNLALKCDGTNITIVGGKDHTGWTAEVTIEFTEGGGEEPLG